MSIHANPAVAAAADFDLYRVCGSARPAEGKLADFRTRDGTPIDARAAVAGVAQGLLGQIQGAETLPDGVLAQRLDLSDHGLDAVTAAAQPRLVQRGNVRVSRSTRPGDVPVVVLVEGALLDLPTARDARHLRDALTDILDCEGE